MAEKRLLSRSPQRATAMGRLEPLVRGRGGSMISTSREWLHRVEWGCGAVAVGRACLFPPLSSGGALVARPWLRFHSHRVTGGGRPPPVPTERGVRLYRTTLFGSWFTALQAPAASRQGGAV